MTQPDWQTRFDELIDNEWWTIDDPDARSMTRTTSKIKQFLATELSTLEQKHRAEVEEIRKAGLQEGSEIVLGAILELLDVAEQDKEMADDPEDPKIRVAYLRDKLLRFEILTTTTSERKA